MFSFKTMNRQRNVKQCLAVIVGLLTFPQLSALAQTTQPQEPQQLYELTVSPDKIIPSLQEMEILMNKQVYVMDGQDLLAPPLPYNASITRNLPQFWRMKVKQEDLPVEGKYEITGNNGTLNPFNNVKINPLDVVTLSKDPSNNTAIVQGGFSLEFTNFSNYGNQSQYSGKLTICVKRKDSATCL
ncbi:hypothetical protein WA1_39125 [Scytonema hofmannii PCC 7110]|uniref:Uncharacterized protein n=1 Tax=Scytonema hofmannii PCC 7110 TaxID=128403 RepID=A0A139X126_9CYAN|nr:hypothetical protein [Scytonema hofmannii]KYC38343.1 hypothetical protein WA1_39125 [Scytonema hofmannii PCC 7110]